MSKMTDEQIKKALECCISAESCCVCGYTKMCDGTTIHQFALDLINRQQADIEDYRRNIKQLTETLTGGNGLRIRVDNMIVYADDLEEWLEFYDKQKSEAIKEFAERLKGIERWTPTDLYVINNLVKEMVGEGK